MTILQSLVAFYDRLDKRGKSGGIEFVPRQGFKPVEIDFILEITADGEPISLIPKIPPDGRRGPKLMMPGAAFNPKPEKGEPQWEDLSFTSRTSGRRSYVFWDKSSYVFGVTAGKKGTAIVPEVDEKSRQDQAAFVRAHKQLLARANDPGLRALYRFVEQWSPDNWNEAGFPIEALDKNIAFRLQAAHLRIEEAQEARQLATSVVASGRTAARCLLSGDITPFTAKHPQFKGVTGAQSSGAAIVSFNSDAFESYGKEKGANAPVSEDAAFRYGAALNWLLDRDNSRVLRIGETTVVFWADEKDLAGTDEKDLTGTRVAEVAEDAFWEGFGDSDAPEPDIDKDQAGAIATELQNVRWLRRVPNAAALKPETRMHVLGLSPNSGRIAVRFWLVDTFGALAANLQHHLNDLEIIPSAFKSQPKAWALLYETAAQRKAENIPPRLGGEFAQAILTGARYPRTLLSSVVGRIRADKTVNGPRAALCKAVINRDIRKSDADERTEGLPVALNPESRDEAYNLGRLFAVYEYAQLSVADRNASIRDKYIGAASATPRRVFPILMRGYEHSASALAKGEGNQRGSGVKAAKAVSQIIGQFDGDLMLPTALRLEDQARFFVGYYHQNKVLYTRSDRASADPDHADAEGATP